MFIKSNTLLVTLLFVVIGSTAQADGGDGGGHGGGQNVTPLVITSSQTEKIAPKSVSCDNAEAEDECATSDTAARAISASFNRYKVSSRAEQAAVIGLMAFESNEFQYNRNHFPGVEGQGTRNMQSPDFNAEYAESIEAISDEVSKAKGDKGRILDILVANEEYDFGSGAWFLTSHCEDDVRKQLQSGSQEGWEAYITDCVGTDANEGRKGYWEAAVEAL